MSAASVSDLGSRAEAWTRYWATGARHSCAGSFEDHYGTQTQAFWTAQFRRMGANDRVLELGCGNGSLIRLLDHTGPDVWPDVIDAVDLAQLDASWMQSLDPALRGRVRLHPGVSAATLPIPDAAVTRIFSQFALEYFASDGVWKELERVAASRAEIALIVHYRDSRPFAVAREERAHCEWLLQPDGALEQAERILPLVAEKPAPGQSTRAAQAEAARAQFNAVFAALGERAAKSAFGDILHETALAAMQILSTASGREHAARHALGELRRKVEDNRLRVAELVDHALDADAAALWVEQLRRSGFTEVELGELVESGYLFGWRLHARRL